MEEGTRTKRTIYVGGVGEDIDEAVIYETFSTFGDILEVQLPSSATNPNLAAEAKHRGFAFVTYTSAGDAQDAIDNMDLNVMRGRVLRVNLARPQKAPAIGAGNRAVWETEDWLRHHARPLGESGGMGAVARAALRASEGDASPEETAPKANGSHGDDEMEE